MPYYKGKSFKINVYTLVNTHWTDRVGNRCPPLNENAADQYLDGNIIASVTTMLANNDFPTQSKILPPKLVPGFIPSRLDTGQNFIYPNDNCDPLKFNTTFCVAIPTVAQNAPQARKGTKVTLSSIYITGTVHKPEIPLPVPNNLLENNVSQARCMNSLTNNQITYYLIYQQCRNQGEGVPDWRGIFYLNGSNKVCPSTYAATDRVNNTILIPAVPPAQPVETNAFSGFCRFTNPQMYLNVDNKEKFVILSTYTLDLDNENTQFDFKIYEKMTVALPMGNSKKKNPIQTIFTNNSPNNTLTYVDAGAVYLVRASYGVYNTLLVSAGGKTATGTDEALRPSNANNNGNNSYLDGCKLYPNESYTMKVNYYDV